MLRATGTRRNSRSLSSRTAKTCQPYPQSHGSDQDISRMQCNHSALGGHRRQHEIRTRLCISCERQELLVERDGKSRTNSSAIPRIVIPSDGEVALSTTRLVEGPGVSER